MRGVLSLIFILVLVSIDTTGVPGSNVIQSLCELLVQGSKQLTNEVRNQPPNSTDWPIHHPNDNAVFALAGDRNVAQ